MKPTRRELLRVSGSAVTVGFSGCQDPLLSDVPRVDLELYNYTADAQQVRVQVLRTDRDDHSDAEVFFRDFEVPAPTDGESAGTHTEEDIVERRSYVLRVQPKYGNGQWYHHHYYPGESTTNDDNTYSDVRLYREDTTGDVYPRFFM